MAYPYQVCIVTSSPERGPGRVIRSPAFAKWEPAGGSANRVITARFRWGMALGWLWLVMDQAPYSLGTKVLLHQ